MHDAVFISQALKEILPLRWNAFGGCGSKAGISQSAVVRL